MEEKNWEEARANCVNLGAKLAEPQDPCDSELLRHFSQISWPSEETEFRSWIGINDITTEGTFVFASSGQEVTNGYWLPTEPNNQGDEDCVHLYVKYHHLDKWNDKECDEKMLSICERNRP